jgi:hypothetical protein
LIGRGLLTPRVGDLLEDLSHARAHEVPPCGFGIVVAAPNPRSLARVEILVGRRLVGHSAMVPLHAGVVNQR